jgi:hypothetical protein
MKIAVLIVSAVLATAVMPGAAHAVAVGQICGGASGSVCDKGLWCEPPTGMCADSAGICIAIPRLCVARKRSKSFKPVCGCNSKTYSSDCFRRADKVGKLRDGKCDALNATRSGSERP